MVADRDLVEAARSERRRVVAALVRGTTDRPLPRPGRALAGGAAAALLLAGAATVLGALAPRPPDGWATAGLVLPEGQAALHVVGDDLPGPEGALHPVAGPLVASLVLGSPTAPATVPVDLLADRARGPEVGIAGAPATAPAVEELAEAWLACPGLGPPVPVRSLPPALPLVSATVRARSDPDGSPTAWLVTADDGGGAVALPVDGPPAERDAVLAAVGAAPRAQAPAVPPGWIELIPPGAALAARTLAVAGAGSPAAYADDPGVALPDGARLGDHLPDPRGGGAVLAAEGLRRLDAFAYAAYLGTAGATAQELPPDAAPGIVDAPPVSTAGWPSLLPGALAAAPCLALDAGSGRVRLVAPPALDGPPGAAALAVVGERTWLVVGGRRHELRDDAAVRLGYGPEDAAPVPAAWLRAVPRGVPLSPAAARCPPDPSSPTGSRCAGSSGTDPREAATPRSRTGATSGGGG